MLIIDEDNLKNKKANCLAISEVIEIPELKIEDIDEALYTWLTDINIAVQTNAESNYVVPIHMFPKERWIYSREGKGLRDPNGTLILPAISILRTNIDRSPGLWAAGTDTQFVEIKKVLNAKTQKYGKAVYKLIYTPFPSFVAIDYDFKIWTSSIVQMNSILEKIFGRLRWWQHFTAISKKGYQFVGIFNFELSNESNLSEFTDEKRIIIYSNNIRMIGYIHPQSQGKIEYTSADISFDVENRNATNEKYFEGEDKLRTAYDLTLKIYNSLYKKANL